MMMYTHSVLSVFSWSPAVSPVIRLRMRSVACAGVATVLLATCLYTGGGAAGDPAHSLHTDLASIEVIVEADRLVYRLYNQHEAGLKRPVSVVTLKPTSLSDDGKFRDEHPRGDGSSAHRGPLPRRGRPLLQLGRRGQPRHRQDGGHLLQCRVVYSY